MSRFKVLNAGEPIEVEIRGDVLSVELWYPPRSQDSERDSCKYVEVGLMDVRAADSIRIHYNFDRDGYVIEQASTFEWDCDDELLDPDWQEVSFVQAWAREKETEDR